MENLALKKNLALKIKNSTLRNFHPSCDPHVDYKRTILTQSRVILLLKKNLEDWGIENWVFWNINSDLKSETFGSDRQKFGLKMIKY